MEPNLNLIELTDVFDRLLEEVNAIELMVYGLAHVKDPYADGLNAVYNHLRDSTDKIRQLLKTSSRSDV